MRFVLALVMALFGFAFAAVAQPTPTPADNRPIVVFIHSQDCKICAQVRPIIDEIEREYKDKASVVRLEVTNDQTKRDSRKTAKTLGVSAFLSFYEDTYPAVGVFNIKKKCTKEFYGLTKKTDFTQAIDKALSTK